ncbi:MAG TPA: CsgG/HfaB family protein [Candidatus Melainabacteria bacterium]|nr:CsgG/HfaB family protein [Candidatus Melainabacteria bacterium]
MNFRKIGSVIMTLAFVMTTLVYAPPAKADAKRRVAVLPFEYGAVQSYVGTVDVGKGITTLLVTKLVNDGTFSVVERQILDQILKEQNFSVSDRADNSTAIKIGKLLSVDAIVVGTVTHFGFENSSMNVGAGIGAATRYIPYVGGFGGFGGGMRVKKGKAKVAIDARIVDTATGEILAATHGDGVSTRSGASLWGAGADVGFDSSGFASSIAGEATMQAVDAVGSQLIGMANRIPDNKSIAQADVQGKIADVTSGKVIKEMFKTVATIALTEVDTTSSTGKISDGTGVRVGDVVKKVTATVTGTVLSSDSKGAESTEESTQ